MFKIAPGDFSQPLGQLSEKTRYFPSVMDFGSFSKPALRSRVMADFSCPETTKDRARTGCEAYLSSVFG